ncbi:dTDP-4-dehydrorhamnose reductase [ANME-1 cluster archaeon GoMg1]|nr:dTDP-4-dehydrorhamnose reductase [ANME-1 cluster archaeon GoMg1]
MRIFITGGSGLLGTKIAEIALERGYEVYIGYCHNKPEFGETVKFDLAKDTDLEVIYKIKPEIIIHTAALTNVDECEVNKELAYKINAEGTKRVAEITRGLGAFLVYVSTDYVFSGEKGKYKEDDEPHPVNYYGYTKLMGEGYCDCIARPCVIYGAKPASGKVNFALWLIETLKDSKKVEIVTDQFITPTLNTNLAKMLLEIAEQGLKGIFHLTGATRISRYDFALRIANKFGLNEDLVIPSRMEEMKWIAARPKDSSLDTSKASKYLKEKPYDLDKALDVLKEEMENA